jgi:hypothetical protein
MEINAKQERNRTNQEETRGGVFFCREEEKGARKVTCALF